MNLNQFNHDVRRILKHYGRNIEVEKAIEEYGEGIEALREYLEYGEKQHAIEEVADCMIMSMQMAYLLGAKDVTDMMRQKIDRQFGRMEKEKENLYE